MAGRPITFYRILCSALLVLLIYSLLTGLTRLTFGGSMDFPCFVDYDEQRNCVIPHGPGSTEGEDTPQIEVFLTTYVAGMHGGGCEHKKTDTNMLDVPTSVIDLRFECDGNSVKVNGQVFEAGAAFEAKNVFDWNPWIVSRLRLKNLGLVADCHSGSQFQRIVVSGSYGTEISIVKGLSISTAIIAGLVYSILKLKRLKTLKPQ
jgi:hypothetical protein